MYGNKGGVAASVCVHETTLSFFSVHLAAGVGRAQHRNEDAEAVLDMRLPASGSGADAAAPAAATSDHTFVFGDLNYRCGCPYDEGVALATEGLAQRGGPAAGGREGAVPEEPGGGCPAAYARLLCEHDELRREMAAGRAFSGFREAPIAFGPTYRYERGSRGFSRKKEQSPSFTDRVLHFTPLARGPAQLGYWSAPGITTSDHTPVAALYSLPVAAPVPSGRVAARIGAAWAGGYELRLRRVRVGTLAASRAHMSIAATTSTYHRAGEQQQHHHHHHHAGAVDANDLEGALLRARFGMHGGVRGACASEYAEAAADAEGEEGKKRVRCAWDAGMLPRLRPNCTAPEALARRTLCVCIEGYRGIYSYGVGACAIELGAPEGGAVEFEDRPLYKGGLVVGRVSGALEVCRAEPAV